MTDYDDAEPVDAELEDDEAEPLGLDSPDEDDEADDF